MPDPLTDADLDAIEARCAIWPSPLWRVDPSLIAAARTDLPRLAAEVRRLRAALNATPKMLFADGREPTENERHLSSLLSWRIREAEGLRQQVAALADRVAAQSELLAQRAERPLTWTRKPPTEPGFYFSRPRPGTEPDVDEVRVKGGVLSIFDPADGRWLPLADFYGLALCGEWAGPIAPPAIDAAGGGG